MDNPIPPVLRASLAHRFLSFVKIAGICLLVALLHIPIVLTHGVLRERQQYREQAANEIAGLWGRRQVVTGPVLAVPYAHTVLASRSRTVDGRLVLVDEPEEQVELAYFLPEALAIDGTVDPEIRRRGIHEVIVYGTALRITGHFQPDFAQAGIAAERIDWDKAQVLLGVSDLKGIRTVGPLATDAGAAQAFEAVATARGDGLPLGAGVAGAAAGQRLNFAMDLALQGSERLDFIPAGKATTVQLRSAWAAPSFGGAFIPLRRTVSGEGFTANWEISHLSRGFAQSWTSRGGDVKERTKTMADSSFGVGFAQSVDGYRMVERAQKYGVLFFVLVFTAFYLFELTAGLRIHPLQYALVGAALCLFFLAFLALSEFWAVPAAYGVAAAACTGMISLYAWSFLGTKGRTLVIAGSLGLTYAGLYFVLQSQDYALVAGTAALFLGLALVMFFTRRINSLELPPPLPA